MEKMADASTKRMQNKLDDIFDRMDDPALTHSEYVQLVREARQLMTDILDRTGHGPTETREHTGEDGGPVDVTVDFTDVDT